MEQENYYRKGYLEREKIIFDAVNSHNSLVAYCSIHCNCNYEEIKKANVIEMGNRNWLDIETGRYYECFDSWLRAQIIMEYLYAFDAYKYQELADTWLEKDKNEKDDIERQNNYITAQDFFNKTNFAWGKNYLIRKRLFRFTWWWRKAEIDSFSAYEIYYGWGKNNSETNKMYLYEIRPERLEYLLPDKFTEYMRCRFGSAYDEWIYGKYDGVKKSFEDYYCEKMNYRTLEDCPELRLELRLNHLYCDLKKDYFLLLPNEFEQVLRDEYEFMDEWLESDWKYGDSIYDLENYECRINRENADYF